MKPLADGKKLTVLHIAPTPFFADRGCHIRIRNEIESLSGYAVDPLLCTYHHGRDIPGIRTHRIWNIPGYTKLGVGYSPYKFPADLLLLFLVLRVAIASKPDVIHGHLHEGALIGWCVKVMLFWRRIPLVMDVQGSLYGELKAYKTFQKMPWVLSLFKGIEKLIYLLPKLFFCSSIKSKETLQHDFNVAPERLLLLGDVVPDCCREGGKLQLDIPEGKTVIVYSGSLLAGKGIEYLQQAMAQLLDQNRDVFFLIIGYPVEEMQGFVEDNGFSDQCLLTGQLAYEELLSCLSEADIAIEPKMSESGEASGKVLHYMAAGLPVVCFHTDNNVSLLGKAGFYAEKPTGSSLADAVAEALQNKHLLKDKGDIAKAVIQQDYSPQNCGAFLYEHYLRLTRHQH